jgi:hypothetical protein
MHKLILGFERGEEEDWFLHCFCSNVRRERTMKDTPNVSVHKTRGGCGTGRKIGTQEDAVWSSYITSITT